MHIAYQLTADDVVRFQIHEFEHSPTARAQRRLNTVGGAIMILSLFGLIGVLAQTMLFLIVGVLFSLLYAWLFPRFVRSRLQRVTLHLYSMPDQRGALGRREMEIAPQGLLARSETTERTTPWESVRDVQSVSGYTYVYIADAAAHVLSQEGVQEGDYDAFVRELRRRVARVGTGDARRHRTG